VHLHTIYQHWETIKRLAAQRELAKYSVLKYLMYQLHNFYYYQSRIQQLVEKDGSRRRYFNLCHQQKEFIMTKIVKELTVRVQP